MISKDLHSFLWITSIPLDRIARLFFKKMSIDIAIFNTTFLSAVNFVIIKINVFLQYEHVLFSFIAVTQEQSLQKVVSLGL